MRPCNTYLHLKRAYVGQEAQGSPAVGELVVSRGGGRYKSSGSEVSAKVSAVQLRFSPHCLAPEYTALRVITINAA